MRHSKIGNSLKSLGKFFSIFFPIILVILGTTALVISMIGTNSVIYSWIDNPIVYGLTTGGLMTGGMYFGILVLSAIASYVLGVMISGIGEIVCTLHKVLDCMSAQKINAPNEEKTLAASKDVAISKQDDLIESGTNEVEEIVTEEDKPSFPQEPQESEEEEESFTHEEIAVETVEEAGLVRNVSTEEDSNKDDYNKSEVEETEVKEATESAEPEQVKKSKPYICPEFMEAYRTVSKDFRIRKEDMYQADDGTLYFCLNGQEYKKTVDGSIYLA